MKLRRFNADGVTAFSNFRSRLTLEPNLPSPIDLLEDPGLTEIVKGDIDVLPRKFANRMEAGIFLNDLIDATGLILPERDRGLWSWLTLFFFDEVCPADAHDNRDVGADARLLPILDNHQRFYRHLLLGPFLIVRTFRAAPEQAIAFLHQPLWEPGEVVEQLASRKELVTNHAVAEVASRLYFDPVKAAFKRGASSKVRGAARRLATLLNQLDLTWYLYGMDADEMIRLLPKEFDRFRPST